MVYPPMVECLVSSLVVRWAVLKDDSLVAHWASWKVIHSAENLVGEKGVWLDVGWAAHLAVRWVQHSVENWACKKVVRWVCYLVGWTVDGSDEKLAVQWVERWADWTVLP